MRKEVNLENITILDLLYVLTKKYGGQPALQAKDKGKIVSISYDDLRQRSVDVSAFLIKNDIKPDAHIAILSENRPEWAAAFFGIISSACVTIPVDAKLSIKEVTFILNDSQSECLFVSKKWLDEILKNRDSFVHLKYIVSFDSCEKEGVINLTDLKCHVDDVRNRPNDVASDNTVLIVYTSGTTGIAKGVELTYKNLLFEVMSLYEIISFTPQDSFISILPLNHMLEITGGLVAPLYGGAKVTYCDSLKPQVIISLMREVKATGMISVPLILKMFYNGIMKEVQALPAYKKKIFGILSAVSKLSLRLKFPLGRFLFRSIHKKFGTDFKYFVCGGAPLDPRLEEDFDVLGFRILQGYGLTETSPVVAVNRLSNRKYGSVGRPLRGVEVNILKNSQIDKEGEILVKGQCVMKGYYNSPEKTNEVIKGGWFYTGDLGYIDDDGFLYISGRVKNLIVLGAGKKVFPEEVEQVMNESIYIKEICVLGRKAAKGVRMGTEEVYALIVPNRDSFSKDDRDNKDIIRRKIAGELNRLSGNLAEYKKIHDFSLYFAELPKTSTRKIKRKEVVNIIEALQKDNIIEEKGEFLESMEFKDDDVSLKIKEIISQEAGVPLEKIKFNSYLSSDLGIDSLQRVEIICAVEKKLNMGIPQEIVYEISTFKDLVKFAKEYKEGRKDIEPDLDREVKNFVNKKRIFYALRFLTALSLRLFLKIYLRLEVHGIKNLPKDKSFIIAANHTSHLDFPAIFSSLPLSKTMSVTVPAAADYFYKNKLSRILLEISLNTFPFERYGNFVQGLKLCRQFLKMGSSLIIFPEGARLSASEMGEFKPGIGSLSCDLNIPVIPVYIKGASEALPKGKIFIKPCRVGVYIGFPLYPCGKASYTVYKDTAKRVREEIMKLKDNEE